MQIVTGSGSELSDSLITHPKAKKVTFTGSVPVGLKIKEKIGLRKITLKLGSNSALIIEPSVPVEKIVKRKHKAQKWQQVVSLLNDKHCLLF